MKTQVFVILLLLVAVIAVGAGYYAVSSKSSSTTTTAVTSSTAANNGISISNDTMTVNTAYGTGGWYITLSNTGSLTASSITVYLFTPTPALLCSGSTYSSGLFYKNCPAVVGTPLPPSSTVSGDTTGAGPASATPGTAYPVDVHLAFTSGTTAWLNTTVTATAATG